MQFKLSFYLYKQNTFIQQKKCCATCIIQISLIFSYLFVNFYITFIKNKISHILLLCMYKNIYSLINKHKYFAIVKKTIDEYALYLIISGIQLENV